jgi:hypothetical protein
MVSRYSVIQYVPNPIADERINIGVVAFNSDVIQVRFVNNWERVRQFGVRDIEFLKDFAQQISNDARNGIILASENLNGLSNEELILRVSEKWINSIQFTSSRVSLYTVDELLEYIADTYLHKQSSNIERKSENRDRQSASRILKSKTRELIRQKFPHTAKDWIKNNYELLGNTLNNKFDVVIGNGKPYFAAHSISFEVQTTDMLTEAISWRILNVKKHQSDLPLGIFVLPPKEEQDHYRQIEKTYEKTIQDYKTIGAEIVEENQLEKWLSEQIEVLPGYSHAH